MADLIALKAEIDGDPLTRGYAGMDDAALAASLNTVNRPVLVTPMTGDQIFANTDTTEFAGLTDAKKDLWVSFCGRSEVDAFGAANVAFVQYIFGGGSSTVSALAAARTQNNAQSRATELNLGGVSEGAVHHARSL